MGGGARSDRARDAAAVKTVPVNFCTDHMVERNQERAVVTGWFRGHVLALYFE